VVAEELGQRRFHGRVVLLVNEQTARCGSADEVGHGYILGSVAVYLTLQGQMLENNGIVPECAIDLSLDASQPKHRILIFLIL
jgi:hypothetical protein